MSARSQLMMLHVLGLFFIATCHGEKSLKIDIYPGFGWDHLRFLDLNPVFNVSNFNDSDIFQSCIEMIPLHENKIETGSVLLNTFDSHTSEYGSQFMIGGKAGFLGFSIGGSYSEEYQSIKQEQKETKTVTLRNQIDYLMVDVILLDSCPLTNDVKQALIEIAKYEATEQPLLATYAAELFVKKYGTHFTSRLYVGGSISEEDFVSESDYESNESNKRSYKAAAEASFLSFCSISTSYSTHSSTSNINQFKNKIHRRILNSKGGDVFILGSEMSQWQSSVKIKPAIIRRGIENITYIIQSNKVPELTLSALTQVRKKISDAVETYIEMNTNRGCLKRGSPSFNWIANVDDGSCAPTKSKFQFGGFIQTCSEDSRLQQ